jgi:hypothetical protein
VCNNMALVIQIAVPPRIRRAEVPAHLLSSDLYFDSTQFRSSQGIDISEDSPCKLWSAVSSDRLRIAVHDLSHMLPLEPVTSGRDTASCTRVTISA